MWNIKTQGACWKGSWQGWAVGKSWRKGKGESGDLQMGGEEEKGVKGRGGEEEEGKEEEKGYLEVTISFQWCKMQAESVDSRIGKTWHQRPAHLLIMEGLCTSHSTVLNLFPHL